MVRAYLDASVLVPLAVEEPMSDVVESFICTATEALIVSEFAAAEAALDVSRLVSMGELTALNASTALAGPECLVSQCNRSHRD